MRGLSASLSLITIFARDLPVVSISIDHESYKQPIRCLANARIRENEASEVGSSKLFMGLIRIVVPLYRDEGRTTWVRETQIVIAHRGFGELLLTQGEND